MQEKKKRIGLLEHELTVPKDTFDITKTKIEPIKTGLDEMQLNKKEEKRYKMIRCPEQLKISIDELSRVTDDKFTYETIEKMYDFYVANALTEEQKKTLKILKSIRK